MNYPVISLTSMQSFLIEAETEGVNIDPPQALLRGAGESFEAKYKKPLYDLSQDFETSFKKGSETDDPDGIEGKFSVRVFEILCKLPVEVLSDKDFWRFLSATTFFRFIVWRDGKNGEFPSRASFGASSRSITMDCVPFRMFNRGLINYEICNDFEDNSYAKLPGTDIWRSHILRVKTSFSPHMSMRMLDKLSEGKLPTSLVRPLAKRLKRLRSNVIFESLEEESSLDLFSSEYLTQSEELKKEK